MPWKFHWEQVSWSGQVRSWSEECQKPQPPLLLKKYHNTPLICIALYCGAVSAMNSEEEKEMLSVLLPFVSQYASIRIATLLEILVVGVSDASPM